MIPCGELGDQLQRAGISGQFWEVVWDELHHQGDVGEATYALIPYLDVYRIDGRCVLIQQRTQPTKLK